MESTMSSEDQSTIGWKHIGLWVVALSVLFQLHILPSARAEVLLPSINEPPASPSYQPVPHLDGALTMVVDSSLRTSLTSLGKGFQGHYPTMKVVVQETSTAIPGSAIDAFLKDFAEVRRGNGYTKGLSGSTKVKLLALPRALTAGELEECVSRFGYRPVSIAIGKNAVALYVNRTNPVPGLSLDQVQAVFARTSEESGIGQIIEWGLVGGEEGWNNFPIHVYGVNRGHRITRQVFHQLALTDKEWNSSLQELSGPASLALTIGNDIFGIGFGPLGFTMPQIRALPIAKKSGMPVIEPTARTVMNGTYPLSQSLFLHINKAPNEELPPFLAEFLKYLHSQEGQTLLTANGVFPLQEFEIARNMQLLQLAPASLTANR
jgi:phosphate transport system substrate-binding protein